MSALPWSHRGAEAQGLWTPLTALPGARRWLASKPSERDLRRSLRAYYLRRLRADALSTRPRLRADS